MSAIYKVTNNINKKVYIGKTAQTVESRWHQHKAEAKPTSTRPFHLALNKYGIENFSVEILETVTGLDIDAREQYWIAFYNSYVGAKNSWGYNATIGGDGTTKYDYQAIGLDYLGTESQIQTAENFGCSVGVVKSAQRAFDIKTINKSGGRAVKQVLANGQTVSYTSIAQAAKVIAVETGKNPQTVRKRITDVVNNKPHQKAYGYYWSIS